MKSIVVYYSLDGNTRFIAGEIAAYYNADLLELKPVREISRVEPVKHMWGGKQVLMKEAPVLEKYSFASQDYDRIFLGTPVWSFSFAPPVRSFLMENSLEGKDVVLFCTHRGLPGRTLKHLSAKLKNSRITGEFDFYKVLDKMEQAREKLAGYLGRL